MKNQYAVIGLGNFGMSIVNTLAAAGNEVLAIDIDEKRINEVEGIVTQAIIANSMEENVLREIGIRNFDTVIVAIGNDIQASILTVLVLKELGINKVVAKALNKLHGQVLTKIGADWVIFPEWDMGERVAHQLMQPNVLNFIELAKDYNIEEIKVPTRMARKSLIELDIRAKYRLNVIAIKSQGNVNIAPSPTQVIQEDDVLVMIGMKEDLHRFANL